MADSALNGDFAELLYSELFARAPEAKLMFSDRQSHYDKMTLFLDILAHGPCDPEALEEQVCDAESGLINGLATSCRMPGCTSCDAHCGCAAQIQRAARAHRQLAITPKLYEMLGVSLMIALERRLHTRLTVETHR